MKRKNILKFVSLLGIGSFVMLAAASCSQANTSTSNPNSSSTNSNPTPAMESVNQELVNAKKTLSDVLATQGNNIMLYVDYAKIQDTLMKAYASAKAVFDSSSSTVQNIKDAQSTLESAISAADKAKKDFDEKNADLVTAYNGLKESLKSEEANLESVKEANYSALKANFERLYTQAKEIVKATLDPVMEMTGYAEKVKGVSNLLKVAVERNAPWKMNADRLVDSFIKPTLAKKDLTGDTSSQAQPANYSFVGYSVNLDATVNNMNGTSSNTIPNWNFATRSVFTNEGGKNKPLSEEESKKLTDVSWIYKLSGDNVKYTLSFRYFGAAKDAYLYFPYKLVNSNDSTKVALHYKLNDGEAKPIEFKTAMSAASTQPAAAAASSIRLVDSHMAASHTMNEAPTVDGIQVAKVHLANVKFNLNTIEFSVPKDKVAPMIGNMYVTSNPANADKIYNSIFGNSLSENNSSVTVDILKGYSLATSYFTYIRQFTDLTHEMANGESGSTGMKADTTYLVGIIGAGNRGTDHESVNQTTTTPNLTGENRTLTVYVNAPAEGQYYISGSYLNGDMTSGDMMKKRYLKFSTDTRGNSANTLQLDVKALGSWTTLGVFDTESMKNINTATRTSGEQESKTLMLKKGLNKVVITGNHDNLTPYISNLTFKLMASNNAGGSGTAVTASSSTSQQ